MLQPLLSYRARAYSGRAPSARVCVARACRRRYGFHKEPAGGSDEPGKRKERLLQLFGHWNDNVVDLIKATPEEDVLRRDIFDR
jgi:hypothetical protein